MVALHAGLRNTLQPALRTLRGMRWRLAHLDEHRPVRRDRDAPGLGGGVVHGPRVAAVHADGLDAVRGAAAGDAVAYAHSAECVRRQPELQAVEGWCHSRRDPTPRSGWAGQQAASLHRPVIVWLLQVTCARGVTTPCFTAQSCRARCTGSNRCVCRRSGVR